MTMISVNSEVLKAADVEHLSTENGKASGEVGESLSQLSSQIDDVGVWVKHEPGFL